MADEAITRVGIRGIGSPLYICENGALPTSLHLFLFHSPGSVVANVMILYANPPGDITDPNTIQNEVENFVRSYLQFLINSGNLGPYSIVPGPVPPVTVEGKQVFSILFYLFYLQLFELLIRG